MEPGAFVLNEKIVQIIVKENVRVAESDLSPQTVPDVIQVITVVIVRFVLIPVFLPYLLGIAVQPVTYIGANTEAKRATPVKIQTITVEDHGLSTVATEIKHWNHRKVDIGNGQLALGELNGIGVFIENDSTVIFCNTYFEIGKLEIVP